MIDAQQWLINLMIDDLWKLVAGLVILILTIEILSRIRGWLK